MRHRDFNFAIAIVISVLAHALLWPVAKHIMVAAGPSGGGRPHSSEVTLVLGSDLSDLFAKPAHPKPTLTDPPEDEMGESTGKGTGAQKAKGDKPLVARQADQDQAFLSRDPVGSGKIGDPPSPNTGPRGQDGHGGQAGGPQVMANPAALAHSDSPTAASQTPAPSPQSSTEKHDTPPAHSPAPAVAAPSSHDPAPKTEVASADRPPPSPAHSPVPVVRPDAPTEAVAPPPSKTASDGSAKADLQKPPADEVKATAPLVNSTKTKEGILPSAPNEGAIAKPVPASGTAPPMHAAPADRPAVVVAPPLDLPKAPVVSPPPPAPASEKKAPDATEAKPAKPAPAPAPVQVAIAAPTLVATGDSKAPGPDKASADPAQESDSESDAFLKNATEAVFHDGRVEVRKGRKVKTTRPHFLPGSAAAFLSIANPVVVLKIKIDERGNVTNVDVLQTSGSVEIDQPCRRAVYDWWFEPTHDKKGRAVPDVIPFTIRFY